MPELVPVEISEEQFSKLMRNTIAPSDNNAPFILVWSDGAMTGLYDVLDTSYRGSYGERPLLMFKRREQKGRLKLLVEVKYDATRPLLSLERMKDDIKNTTRGWFGGRSSNITITTLENTVNGSVSNE